MPLYASMKKECTVLAIESSATISSAALRNAGGIIAKAAWQEPRRGNTMLQQIESIMTGNGKHMADISAISVGLGPGNYSGLRVSFTIAKTLALPHRIPVCGYSSAIIALEKFINDGFAGDMVAVFGDARRERSWVVTYSKNKQRLWQETKALTLVPDSELPGIIAEKIPAISPDWEQRSQKSQNTISDLLPGVVRQSIVPDASTLANMTSRDITTGTAPTADSPLYMHPAVFVAPKFPCHNN